MGAGDYTGIGMDLGRGRDTAVLGVLRDGVWSFRQLDPENPADFAGLKIDAVWVDELDHNPARALSPCNQNGVVQG